MSWSRIGYFTTLQPSDTYKKFQPQKIRPPSKQKRMQSIQRSKSFEKIKMSIEGRDNSKNSCSQHIDLSYQRPSTPISKSNTSIHIMQHIASSHFIGMEAGKRMQRIKSKLELYVKDLKQEMRILKSQIWIKNQQFMDWRSDVEMNVQKLVNNFNRQLANQKQELSDALYKISKLSHENKQLKQKIQVLSQNNKDMNNISPILEKKYHSTSYVDTAQSIRQEIKSSRSFTDNLSSYRMKGFHDIQNTINQLKQIFVDPFQT